MSEIVKVEDIQRCFMSKFAAEGEHVNRGSNFDLFGEETIVEHKGTFHTKKGRTIHEEEFKLKNYLVSSLTIFKCSSR